MTSTESAESAAFGDPADIDVNPEGSRNEARRIERRIRIERGLWTLFVVVIAFKCAVSFPQIAYFTALKISNCDVHYELGRVIGSGSVTGVETCNDSVRTFASLVALYIGFAIAFPVLIMFRKRFDLGGRPWPLRPAGAWLYLTAVASIADSLSASFVFAVWPHFEAKWLISQGIPFWILPVPAFAGLAGLASTIMYTTEYFGVELLRHPPEHVPFLRKAVWFKLSIGVIIVSGMRLLSHT